MQQSEGYVHGCLLASFKEYRDRVATFQIIMTDFPWQIDDGGYLLSKRRCCCQALDVVCCLIFSRPAHRAS